MPLYIRIDGKACKVESAWVKKIFSNITEYNCKIYDNGKVKPLLLTYYHAEGVWGI